MNPKPKEPPTEYEIDLLMAHEFIWRGKGASWENIKSSDWLFVRKDYVYDLSAADLKDIKEIKAKRLFLVKG